MARDKINKETGKEKSNKPGGKNEGNSESLFTALKKKVPRTTVVAITCVDNNTTYADILKKAKENISLKALDIENAKIKRAMTGGILI